MENFTSGLQWAVSAVSHITTCFRCDTILLEGKKVALTEEMKQIFTEACETLAGMGERVLGFVHLDLDPTVFP